MLLNITIEIDPYESGRGIKKVGRDKKERKPLHEKGAIDPGEQEKKSG